MQGRSCKSCAGRAPVIINPLRKCIGLIIERCLNRLNGAMNWINGQAEAPEPDETPAATGTLNPHREVWLYQLLVGVGSITFAQPSVGAAAICPTTGTIFNAADPMRHGAANKPHPSSGKEHTPTTRVRVSQERS